VADVRQIMVGGVKVGLAGLDSILAQVRAESPDSDEVTAERLLELVRQANYVMPSKTEEYKAALLREFRRSTGEDVPYEPGMLEIRVLGPGCPRCDSLMAQVLSILEELGIDADVDHVRDLNRIADFGPVATPSLVINGKVVVSGRVPTRSDLTRILKEASQ
jgi:small redox-active disulfide protein 2